MKPHLIFLFVLFYHAQSAMGQKKQIYAEINLGYAAGLSRSTDVLQNRFYESTYNLMNDEYGSRYISENVYVSFGKGWMVNAFVGYPIHRILSAKLGFRYHVSPEFKGINESNIKEIYPDYIRLNSTIEERIMKGQIFSIMPSVELNPGFDKLSPFASLGLIFGWGNLRITETSNNLGRDQSEEKTILKRGLSLGINYQIGAAYSINKDLKITVGVDFVHLSYTPKTGKITHSSLNNIDQIPTMTVYDREIEFVDKIEYSSSSAGSIDTSQPRQELKTKYPFSSMGFTIGARYYFSFQSRN